MFYLGIDQHRKQLTVATIIWHMLKSKRPYLPGDPATWKAAPKLLTGAASAPA